MGPEDLGGGAVSALERWRRSQLDGTAALRDGYRKRACVLAWGQCSPGDVVREPLGVFIVFDDALRSLGMAGRSLHVAAALGWWPDVLTAVIEAHGAREREP